jgi:transcriptional regulator with XRE-family HTH domain
VSTYLRKNDYIKKIGLNIRSIRRSKQLTMIELSKKARIRYIQLSRIERGLINTSVSHIYVLAKALDVDIKEIMEKK